MLKHTDKLLLHEYLFLAANSQNRLQMFKEKIQVGIKQKKDSIGIYELDETLEFNPNMDLRLEDSMQGFSRISYDFDVRLLRPPTPPQKEPQKKSTKYSEPEDVRRFKELLKDPSLISEVKAAISNSRDLLNKTQNNPSRFSYMKYRRERGVMGSLEPSKGNLFSKPITRNHSSSIKTEILLANHSNSEIFDYKSEGYRNFAGHKSESRPVSASTVKYKRNQSRPNTAKRPVTGRSLASTAPIHKEELYYVNSFRETIMETYQKKK